MENLDNMTIGEAKKELDASLKKYLALSEMFGKTADVNLNKIEGLASSAIGSYVLVRSRNEGINAGYLKAADETGVVLDDARRLWYHKPNNDTESWYEGVSIHGLSSDSKTSAAVSRKIIIEDYSITLCSEVAEKSIKAAKSYAKN